MIFQICSYSKLILKDDCSITITSCLARSLSEASEDPNTRITSLEEVIKCISESMEATKKTNNDIASRLPTRKEPRHEERRKTKAKDKMQGGQGGEESFVHDK
jgi:hypothetical protein